MSIEINLNCPFCHEPVEREKHYWHIRGFIVCEKTKREFFLTFKEVEKLNKECRNCKNFIYSTGTGLICGLIAKKINACDICDNFEEIFEENINMVR